MNDMQEEDRDAIDRELVRLLSRRAELFVDELRAVGASGVPTELRSAVMERVRRMNPGPLPAEVMEAIFGELISGAWFVIRPVTVAFLGPIGTFTELAARNIFGASIRPSPQRTIQDVFREVESGRAQSGVVPIENSTEGSVTQTLDELLETGLLIVAEHYVRISYDLLARGGTIESVRKIFAHPQSIGQCKGWLRAHVPNAELVPVDSTARAAEMAAQEEGAAALASTHAGEKYHLISLATGVEDVRQNYTRFFVLGRTPASATGSDKTSIVCAVRDRPGALLEMLKPFGDSGINLTRIESRPDKKKMWAYNFFIDFTGHRDDEVVKHALDEVREKTLFIKILGSYPSGNYSAGSEIL